MKFVSKHAGYRLVVAPADYEWQGQSKRKLVRGLSADFHMGEFDSEAAQRKHNWTDAQRREVEDGLLQSDDFGVRFYLSPAEDEVAALVQQAPLMEGTTEGQCALTFMLADGTATKCSNRPKKGSIYCGSHQSMAERAMQGA
jgi:hypothetical protein